MVNSWYNMDVYYTNMESIKNRNYVDSLLWICHHYTKVEFDSMIEIYVFKSPTMIREQN